MTAPRTPRRGLATLAWLLGWMVLLSLAAPARAQLQPPLTVPIRDAYVELHTGPGRGYPVFHVAARGERVELLLRHTDWVKLRTERGQQGWARRAALASTLAAAGITPGWRDAIVDSLASIDTLPGGRLEVGAAWGRFEAEPMLELWARWRAAEGVSVQLAVGQVQGLYSGTDLWRLNLTFDPWSDRRWSPYLAVGVGGFTDLPNLSLVDATRTDAKLANAGVGLRGHLGPRLVLRGEWTLYTAFLSDRRTREYRALTAGLSFFF